MHDSFSDQNISLWFILEYNKSAIEYIPLISMVRLSKSLLTKTI